MIQGIYFSPVAEMCNLPDNKLLSEYTVGLVHTVFVGGFIVWSDNLYSSMGLSVNGINPSLFYLILPSIITVTHFTL